MHLLLTLVECSSHTMPWGIHSFTLDPSLLIPLPGPGRCICILMTYTQYTTYTRCVKQNKVGQIANCSVRRFREESQVPRNANLGEAGAEGTLYI